MLIEAILPCHRRYVNHCITTDVPIHKFDWLINALNVTKINTEGRRVFLTGVHFTKSFKRNLLIKSQQTKIISGYDAKPFVFWRAPVLLTFSKGLN